MALKNKAFLAYIIEGASVEEALDETTAKISKEAVELVEDEKVMLEHRVVEAGEKIAGIDDVEVNPSMVAETLGLTYEDGFRDGYEAGCDGDKDDDGVNEGSFDKEYNPILKKHGFKMYGTKSDGSKVYRHAGLGHQISINKHGSWKGADEEGTAAHSLERHIKGLKESSVDEGSHDIENDAHKLADHHEYMAEFHEKRSERHADLGNHRMANNHRAAYEKHATAADHFRTAAKNYKAGNATRAEVSMEKGERWADEAEDHKKRHGLNTKNVDEGKINEVSKNTLASYARISGKHATALNKEHDKVDSLIDSLSTVSHSGTNHLTREHKDALHQIRKHLENKKQSLLAKSYQREHGQYKALKKLVKKANEEVEPLDEAIHDKAPHNLNHNELLKVMHSAGYQTDDIGSSKFSGKHSSSGHAIYHVTFPDAETGHKVTGKVYVTHRAGKLVAERNNY